MSTTRATLLFDMNGVLVDDEHLHAAAFRRVLSEHRLAMTDEEYLTFFAGRTDREGLLSFLAEKDPELTGDVNSMIIAKSRHYETLAWKSLTVFPEAAETLQALHSRGHNLALVTSSTRLEAEAILRTLKVLDIFSAVVTAEDVEQGKPAPEPYLKAAKLMEQDSSSCVVIEDTPSGIESAVNARMSCVAIVSTHKRESLRAADVIIDEVSQLLQLDLEALVSTR